MLRVGALIGLVATVAALSRLDGHSTRPAAAGADPLARAASVVKRGMTEATVRRLAGRPHTALRVRGVRCLFYATDKPIEHRVETIVCFGRTGRVSAIRSEHAPHSQPPPDL